jgi:CBS domain-containing protein
MKASDLMTTQVVSVGPETGIDEILAILLERRISGVPVVDAGRVIGSVGEGELLPSSRDRHPGFVRSSTRSS